MSDPAVLAAIRAHLEAIAGLPTIIWPNESKKVPAPFLTFDNGPQNLNPITIDGEERVELRPQVSLHEEVGTYTADGDVHLWAIAQAFKFNTDILSGATKLAQCLQTPVPDNGESHDGIFRRNMTLRVVTYQTL